MRLSVFVLSLATLIVLSSCAPDEPRPAEEQWTDDVEAETAIDPPERSPVRARETEEGVQVIEILVTSEGFEPASIELERGVSARMVFTRTTESGCAEEIQIPAFDIEPVHLPLNEPVALEFDPVESGVYQFVCGMDMMRGRLVVSP